MALVSLKYIEQMHPRLILRPWFKYRDFRYFSRGFILHEYVVAFWHCHYSQAETFASDLTARLQSLIQTAWVAERRALALRHDSSAELDLNIYAEAREIGLELSRAYDLAGLESAYTNMGAGSTQIDLSLSNEQLIFTGPGWTHSCERVTTPPRDKYPPKCDNNDSFDLNDWYLIEPFSLARRDVQTPEVQGWDWILDGQ
jgi:hypothetical protein